MIHRIDPPIPLETPKGPGWAHFLIDNGLETDLQWVVFLNADGQCWTFQNPDIRACTNYTAGRPAPEKLVSQ